MRYAVKYDMIYNQTISNYASEVPPGWANGQDLEDLGVLGYGNSEWTELINYGLGLGSG